jgi:hypothetical protein
MVFCRDPGNQRLGTVTACDAEHVCPFVIPDWASFGTSTCVEPDRIATSAPSCSALRSSSNLPSFRPPDHGFMIR